MESRQGKTADR
jgi:hypothetical protein